MKELGKRSSSVVQNSVRFSFLVSLSDIALNLVASILTGSAVLFSQALQGLSDAFSSALVFFGYRHSKRRANKDHPFGYGREIFFWVLIASVVTGGVTGVLSVARGFSQLQSSTDISSAWIAILVLFIGLIANSYSVKTSMQSLVEKRNPFKKFLSLLNSSYVETKISILIDSLGSLSAFVGLTAIVLFSVTGNTAFDSYGAIVIGSLTILGAMSLIYDVYGLIIGKSADQETLDNLKSKVLEVDGVLDVKRTKAVLIGSGVLLVVVHVVFDHHLSLLQTENRSFKIRRELKKVAGVRHVVVESEQL